MTDIDPNSYRLPDRFGEKIATGSKDGQSVCINMAPNTLEEEQEQGGWTRLTRPYGRNVDPLTTAGMRGESSIDDDVHLG